MYVCMYMCVYNVCVVPCNSELLSFLIIYFIFSLCDPFNIYDIYISVLHDAFWDFYNELHESV